MANEKKIILYLITQSELGGAGRYVFDLADGLKDKYKAIIAFGEQGEGGEMAKKFKEAGIEYCVLPHLKRAISPFNDFLALIEIIKLIKKIKPDIIHLNSSKISILGSLAAKICSMIRACLSGRQVPCYVIYTVHGWVFNEPLPLRQKLFYKYAEKFTARFKDKLICVSEFDRRTALKEKIAAAEKLVTIHNGIASINFLSAEDARRELNARFPFPAAKFVIGTIGGLYPTKGFGYLVGAAKILKKTIPSSEFAVVIIGEGEERKKLEKLIEKYGLKENVILAGRIDAAVFLKAFDIYVCSSVKEGLSYTILEAMQAGLPIVATAVGGNPEMIEDYKTGLLVRAADGELLAAKIKEFMENQKLRQDLGEAAKEKAGREFGLSDMLKKTEKVYNSF